MAKNISTFNPAEFMPEDPQAQEQEDSALDTEYPLSGNKTRD